MQKESKCEPFLSTSAQILPQARPSSKKDRDPALAEPLLAVVPCDVTLVPRDVGALLIAQGFLRTAWNGPTAPGARERAAG